MFGLEVFGELVLHVWWGRPRIDHLRQPRATFESTPLHPVTHHNPRRTTPLISLRKGIRLKYIGENRSYRPLSVVRHILYISTPCEILEPCLMQTPNSGRFNKFSHVCFIEKGIHQLSHKTRATFGSPTRAAFCKLYVRNPSASIYSSL